MKRCLSLTERSNLRDSVYLVVKCFNVGVSSEKRVVFPDEIAKFRVFVQNKIEIGQVLTCNEGFTFAPVIDLFSFWSYNLDD